MLLQPSRMLLAVSMTGLFCLGPLLLGQPKYKDDAEFQLYDSILKDTNPKTKLDKLQDWEKKYPSTEFVKERKQLFFTTYIGLNMPKQTVDTAKQILADDPKDFNALYYTMLLTRNLYASQPSILEDGEKASKALLAGIESPPPGVAADQWAKLRPPIEVLAHVTLGFAGMQRKNWDGAEAEMKNALKVNPNNGEVDYLMAVTLLNKKNNSAALYYYARAAAYDGEGALTPQGRTAVQTEVQNLYKLHHGSTEGFNELLASAKNAPNPPDGFHIKSKGELAQESAQASAAAEEKLIHEHPDWALWKSIKETLVGAGGADYFKNNMKDAKVLTLKGRVVKLEPANKPKTILLAMEDGTTTEATTADATLKFEAALPGNVDPGTELTFEGVGDSYTASPLMVVFNIVDKADLHGWTGKNAAAPPPVRHRPPAKKK
jgi:tetratricopeptide (TPR) repeat protein